MKKCIYNLKDFGMRVRQIRNVRRLSQAELAEKLDINPKNISRIECGTLGMSLTTLSTMCAVLDISADYLLFGECGKDSPESALLSGLTQKQYNCAISILKAYVNGCTDSKK